MAEASAATEGWAVLFDLTVHPYYRGELNVGREASEWLLSLPVLPAYARTQTRRNQSFYALALSQLIPSAETTPISFPVAEGWTCFNPSIASWESGDKLLVRSSNYVREKTSYRVHDTAGIVRTKNYLVSLDVGLTCCQVEPIADSAARSRTVPFPVVGFEDCRLFRYDGSWHVTATTREHNPPGLCQIALLRLDENGFSQPELLSGAETGRHEKNWAPVLTAGELSFIYSFWPTVVLRYVPSKACVEQVSADPGPLIAQDFRGGSQAIAVKSGFLCVVHESIPFDDGSYVYLHRFVLLDTNFKISRISLQFYFVARGIEFCAGLALRGSLLTASFGVDDREAYIASMQLDEVLARLRPPHDMSMSDAAGLRMPSSASTPAPERSASVAISTRLRRLQRALRPRIGARTG